MPIDMQMTKRRIKRVGLAVLLTPFILLLFIIVLLYIPPVQDYLRKEAAAYASKATGMRIYADRIDLRFPLRLLVRGVEVVQPPDTLLTLGSFSASVQLLPLFAGRIEWDDVTLRNGTFNTANLMAGARLSGVLGRLSLQSHGIDLRNATALINSIDLSDTHIRLLLNDAAASPVDTAQAVMNGQIKLQRINLKRVSFDMQTPADDLRLTTHLGEAAVDGVEVDLRNRRYGLERLTIGGSSVNYDMGTAAAATGFDPSHIALRDVRIGLDSIVYEEPACMSAVIREWSMNERSGLGIASMRGRFRMDSLLVCVPELQLATRHSELRLSAQTFRRTTGAGDDRMTAQLNARIGKQDVLLLAGGMSEAFKKQYPSRPLIVQLAAKGDVNRINISRLSVDLPGVFSLTGGGDVANMPDSLNRTGNLEMQMHTQDLNFLTALSGMADGNSKPVIPRDMTVAFRAGMRGPQYSATLHVREGAGTVQLDAAYNRQTGVYSGELKIDSLAVDHFLPGEQFRTVAAVATLKGQGADLTSVRTSAAVQAVIQKLEYGPYRIGQVHLEAELKEAVASARIVSNNDLLVMTADARLGKDTVDVALDAGDLRFRLCSQSTLETLLEESTAFIEVLSRQVKDRRLNPADLRRALPSAAMTLSAGADNPLHRYLALHYIKYKALNVDFEAAPHTGMNGHVAIQALNVDSIRLDTVYFAVKQDTSSIALRGGVVNGLNHPQLVFQASLTGEVRDGDTELTLKLGDGKGGAIELAEVSRALPYFPHMAGLLFLEANYKQSAASMQLSAEGRVNRLHYNGNRIGNLGLGMTWLPNNRNTHYLNAYLTNEGVEVLNIDGNYDAAREALDMNVHLKHFPLHLANVFIPGQPVELAGGLHGGLAITGTPAKPAIDGEVTPDSVTVSVRQYGLDFRFDNCPVHVRNSRLMFDKFAIYTTGDNPFAISGYVDVGEPSNPVTDLSLQAKNYPLLNAARKKDGLLYGKVFLDFHSTVKGSAGNLVMRGDINLLSHTDVTYVMTDSPLSVQDRLDDLVVFTALADTVRVEPEKQPPLTLGGMDIMMSIHIDQTAKVKVDLSQDRSSRIELQGGGDLAFQYTPHGEMSLSGRYTLFGGTVKYALPVIPLKEFSVNKGSYIEWGGNPADPNLKFKATERMRVSVPNDDGHGSRMVNFNISIEVKNKLNNLELTFNLEAPDDGRVQRQLAAMDDAERSKQAIALMATGVYLAGSGSGAGDFDMGTAFNSLLQRQIAGLAGTAFKTAGINFGMDNYDGADGDKHTDYTFSYSQRFFNDRVQVVVGGTISGGQDVDDKAHSFIDNVSLEYRLDDSGTRYVRLFHNKEYENIMESNITETGGGIVLRKKVGKLGELFIFKKNKP
jgi:hypothetical protein